MLSSPLSPETFQTLFPKAKNPFQPIFLTPLKGGANNRVFLAKAGALKFALKEYFSHPNDLRNRLHHEYAFLSYAWKNGIRNIPCPIEKNDTEKLGLYTFLEGSPATPSDVHSDSLDGVIQFFLQLNQKKESSLPNASEASFTFQEHVQLIEQRFLKLQGMSQDTPIDKEAYVLLQKELLPAWEKIKDSLPKEPPLSLEERCISPSDFGFHNVLMKDRHPFFIDFEYAGWDDPAKTICDFFLQPKIPVPLSFYPQIASAFSSVSSSPSTCLKRAELLFPIHRIKWCLIMLNTFCRIGKIRRDFSHSEELQAKEQQIAKVRKLLFMR